MGASAGFARYSDSSRILSGFGTNIGVTIMRFLAIGLAAAFLALPSAQPPACPGHRHSAQATAVDLSAAAKKEAKRKKRPRKRKRKGRIYARGAGE